MAAVVAAAVGAAVQAEGGAVSLDVTETLAVVALLGCVMLVVSVLCVVDGVGSLTLGGTGKRAGARLVAWMS